MIDDIFRALTVERKRLARMKARGETAIGRTTYRAAATEVISGPSFTGSQIDRLLRIEIAEDNIYELASDLELRGMRFNRQAHEGPLTLQGVDLYFVPRLPAPGWRIINPMAKP